jgi:hypothetical protein
LYSFAKAPLKVDRPSLQGNLYLAQHQERRGKTVAKPPDALQVRENRTIISS